MAREYMDLAELVRWLGMDYRKVDRLAKRGEIPCQRVGGQFRFNRAEVTLWLQQQLLNGDRQVASTKSDLASMDAAISAQRQTDPEDVIVAPILHRDGIETNLAARTKSSVLKELVALGNETGLIFDSQTLLEALNRREALCSTAIEHGIAIPHPRRPLPYAVAESILVFAHTPQGIGFGAPDGQLSDLFFMICSQDDKHHLHVLARLCRMLNHKELTHQLRQTQCPDEVIDLMRKRELEVIADGN